MGITDLGIGAIGGAVVGLVGNILALRQRDRHRAADASTKAAESSSDHSLQLALRVFDREVGRVESLEKRVEAHQQSINQLQRELDEERLRNTELTTRIDELTKINTGLREDNEVLRKANESLTEINNELRAQSRRFMQTAQAVEETLADAGAVKRDEKP